MEEKSHSSSPSPPELAREEHHHLRTTKSRSSASFTQIPGPLPPHKRESHLASASHSCLTRKQRVSSSPPLHHIANFNFAKSQGSSPRHGHGHGHGHGHNYNHNHNHTPTNHGIPGRQTYHYPPTTLPYSRSENNSPRSREAKTKSFKYNNSGNTLQFINSNSAQQIIKSTKRARFSTNEAVPRRTSSVHRNKKTSKSNYLESVKW